MVKHKYFWITFAIAIVVRVVWLLLTDNACYGDAAARLNIANSWLNSSWKVPTLSYKEILNPSLDWLPLHFYITGAVGFFTKDMVYAPRIFTAIVSIATIIPLYKVTQLKFGRSTALIAALILTFYGIHIVVSSITLSGPYYFFFLIWAYYFIEKYLQSNQEQKLWVLGLMLASCCLLRYEAWFFVPLVIITLPFLKKMNLSSFFSLLLFPFIAISFVMIMEVMQGQHPLRGILYSDFEVTIRNLLYKNRYYANLLAGYLPFYFLSATIVVFQSIQKKQYKLTLLHLLYFLPVLPFVFKILNGTVTSQARYVAIYMIPGIIYIAWLIQCIFLRLQLRTFGKLLFLCLYLVVANYTLVKHIAEKRLPVKYAPGFMHSANYMRDSIYESKAYIGYGLELSNCNWTVYANLYDAFHEKEYIDSIAKANHIDASVFIQRTVKGAHYRITGHEYEWQTWSSAHLNQLLDAKKITHIVIFPGGILAQHLHFSKPNETYRNKAFKQLFSEDGYMIYAIE